jgi:hypothetical protein
MLTPSQHTKLETVANELAIPNNTITTLEIKNELRKRFPKEWWVQQDVSDAMRDLSDNQGKFDYYDNGTFRTYTLVNVPNAYDPKQVNAGSSFTLPPAAPVKQKKVRSNQDYTVDRKTVMDLIEQSNGLIFSIQPQNLALRLKAFDTPKGYLTVYDMNEKTGATDCVINMQSISGIKINGDNYTIK